MTLIVIPETLLTSIHEALHDCRKSSKVAASTLVQLEDYARKYDFANPPLPQDLSCRSSVIPAGTPLKEVSMLIEGPSNSKPKRLPARLLNSSKPDTISFEN